MIAYEGLSAFCISAPEEGALDGGAGRAACDDPAAVEDILKGLVGEGVQVGICDVPLAAADKINTCCLFQRCDECFAVGFFEVIGVEEGYVPDAGLFLYFFYVFLIICGGVAVCSGDHHDLCFVFSAGELGEFIPYGGGGADVAADDEEGTFFGSVEGCRLLYFYWGIDEGFVLECLGLRCCWGCGRCC